MRTFRTIAATATAALALGGVFLAAPAAQAAPKTSGAVVHDNEGFWYRATTGQANTLTITDKSEERTDPGGFPENYHVVTFDDRYDITFDARAAEVNECKYPSATDHTVVQCVTPAAVGSDDSARYQVAVGDGNDSVTLDPDNNADAVVYGGKGNDTLTDDSLSAVLHGEDGNDRLHAGGGGWGMGPFGGKGDDTITACAYACYGGPGNDSLSGDAEGNNLYGEDGHDVIRGKQGRDTLYGGKGNDKLYGDQGDDTLWGNSGDDALYGGAGKDTLSGGPGKDKVQQG